MTKFKPGQLVARHGKDHPRYGVVRHSRGGDIFSYWLRENGTWSDGKTFLYASELELVTGDEADRIWAEYCAHRLTS